MIRIITKQQEAGRIRIIFSSGLTEACREEFELRFKEANKYRLYAVRWFDDNSVFRIEVSKSNFARNWALTVSYCERLLKLCAAQ